MNNINHLLSIIGVILIIIAMVGCVENNVENETILTVLFGDYSAEYSLQDLESMDSYTGTGRSLSRTGRISNSSSFIGVRISEILDEIPNLPYYYNVSVVASDGYEVMYTMDDIDGNVDIYDDDGNILTNGTAVMILAYKEDGKYYSEIDPDSETGPLRVAFVDDNVITSSKLWSKMVISIEVIQL